jgi:magnesium transporter
MTDNQLQKHKPEIDYVMKLSASTSIKHRLPWLILGLIGGITASHIVSSFEEILQKNLILAAFIPLIVYMSDAVGTQMESFVIRDLAIHKLKFLKYFAKQLLITASIALLLGLTLFAYTIITQKDPRIALVLSASMFASITSSVLTGLVFPLLFNKLRFDPANASGPIATIIQDIVSVTIYFSVASYLL